MRNAYDRSRPRRRKLKNIAEEMEEIYYAIPRYAQFMVRLSAGLAFLMFCLLVSEALVMAVFHRAPLWMVWAIVTVPLAYFVKEGG